MCDSYGTTLTAYIHTLDKMFTIALIYAYIHSYTVYTC